MTVAVYFSISRHLQSGHGAAKTGSDHVLAVPDCLRVIPYDLAIPSMPHYWTSWTTHTAPSGRNYLPVGSRTYTADGRAIFVAMQLDIVTLLQRLRKGLDDSLSITPAMHICTEAEYSALGGNLSDIGSRGQHCVWICSAPTDGEIKCRIAAFPAPNSDVVRGAMSSSVRALSLPVRLSNWEALDFCDEAGILGIVMNGTEETRIHFFDF